MNAGKTAYSYFMLRKLLNTHSYLYSSQIWFSLTVLMSQTNVSTFTRSTLTSEWDKQVGWRRICLQYSDGPWGPVSGDRRTAAGWEVELRKDNFFYFWCLKPRSYWVKFACLLGQQYPQRSEVVCGCRNSSRSKNCRFMLEAGGKMWEGRLVRAWSVP